MIPLLRPVIVAVLGLALAWATPSSAQSFEGLDLSQPSKSKKKKSSSSSKPRKKSANQASDSDDSDEDGSTSSSSSSTPSMGLDLTSDGGASQSGDAMAFDGMDLSGKSSERQRLDITISLFKNDEYEKAAMSAFEMLQDPKLAGLHVEARYIAAKALYRMGLYHSSLGEFSKLLALGPQTKYFRTSLEWLFYISRKTRNESVILDELARYANHQFPERFRSEFHYLLARYHFVRGRALDQVERREEADASFNEVKRLALLIPKTDVFYPRTKYLEGLTFFRFANRGGHSAAKRRADVNTLGAIEAMKEVVRLTRTSGGDAEQMSQNQKLRELAFMQLARTHYGMQQNRYALFYFSKVERGTSQWLQSLFEASWANYRVGQYEQALGNLITLSSPFFREEYFPEALILKAVIYYENCRYRESNLILQDFERTYLPVHDQLELITRKQMDASEYYGVLAEVQKKNKDRNETDIILERILRLALTDQDLKKTNDSILELEEEMEAFATKGDTFRYSEFSKKLLEGLKEQRTALIERAGIMAKGKLESELVSLKQLLANGLRIKFETTTKEKEFLEEQLKAGGRTAIVKKYRYSVAVADDQLYWPYEGEYWRDEVGTYQYTLTKGCIDRDAANRLQANERN
jgi:tetratricopeptide (TPR) repeat protein